MNTFRSGVIKMTEKIFSGEGYEFGEKKEQPDETRAETQEAEQPPTPQQTKNEQEQIKEQLESMVSEMARFGSNNYNARTIIRLVPYIKFNDRMQPKITTVPKKELIEIVKTENPDMAYLFENTDIGDLLPQSFELSNNNSYDLIPPPISNELKNLLDLRNIHTFNSQSRLLVIPNYNVLSLFIKDGQDFRDYLKTLNLNSQFILGIKNDYNGRNNQSVLFRYDPIFSSKNLRDYVDKSNDKEIAVMVKEVYELRGLMDRYRRDAETVRTMLADKLKQYHPDLML